MRPAFEALAKPPGVRVRDPIENAQFELYTGNSVDPSPAGTEQFVLPVDTAASIRTDQLEIPQLVNVFLWSGDDTLVGQSTNQEVARYAPDWYSLDIDIGPMKLQAAVESGVTIRRAENSTVVEFDGVVDVALGARSLHESPAATITIGDDVEDAMRAISLTGSALKTTSPERSFPTLRGHPPLVERGEHFDAPDGLVAPDTDVTIEIPRDYGDLYRVSSLAYYLGADVVPGDGRTLVMGEERYDLDTDLGFEREVTTLLKHVFFLDCVTRTAGFYQVDLHERNAVEDELPFDPATVYDLSLADRLSAYLDVPYEVTDPHVPRWKLTADVAPDPEHVESIPFLVKDLAEVRVPDLEKDDDPEVQAEPDAITEFLRGDGGVARSASDSTSPGTNVVKPDETDAIEHAWLADGFPLGASKAAARYYRRRLDNPVEDSSSITIDIVCNDPEMTEEDIVQEFYGARDFFEFEINAHYELSTDELAELLTSKTDFLHYIGHVEDGGFQCTDGLLDARTLESTAVRAFLLNACRSYIQGEALVERGSRGGIVTLANISNDPAVRIGRALARLLNNGFSLLAGLSVARNVTLFGNQYITIGDGALQLVQSSGAMPTLIELVDVTDGYELTPHAYPTSLTSMGTMVTPYVGDNDVRYLNSGRIDTFSVSEGELIEYFNHGVVPVLYGDELTWSDTLLENQLN